MSTPQAENQPQAVPAPATAPSGPKPTPLPAKPAPRNDLLAQIPDIRAPGEAEVPPVSDGRILSSGLSTKILLGGGMALLLLAILPFLFGSKDAKEESAGPAAAVEAPPSDEPLATLAPSAPKWEGKTAYTMKEAAVEAAKSQANPDSKPQLTAKGQPRVAALSGSIHAPPLADQPRSLAPPEAPADRPSPGVASYPNDPNLTAQRTAPTYDPRTRPATPEANRPATVGYQASAPGSYDPNAWQPQQQSVNRAAGLPANRTAETADYRYPTTNRPQADYARRQAYPRTQPDQPTTYPQTSYPQTAYPQTQPVQASVPTYPNTAAPRYAEDYRQQPAPQTYPNTGRQQYTARDSVATQAGYYASQPSPRIADRRVTAPPDYPTTSPAATTQPGVARFKGTIEKPTYEKGHDPTGSSIY